MHLFSYVNYLRQMFWPVDLVPFYIHPEVATRHLGNNWRNHSLSWNYSRDVSFWAANYLSY